MNKTFSLGRRSSGSIPSTKPVSSGSAFGDQLVHGQRRQSASTVLYTVNDTHLSTSPTTSPLLDNAQLMRKNSNASSNSYQSVLSSDSSASSYCHVITPTSSALDEAGEGEGWNEFLKLRLDPITTQSTISDHCKTTSKKGKSSLQSKLRLFCPKEHKSPEASLHYSRRCGSKPEPVAPAVEKSDLYELKDQPMSKEYYVSSARESPKRLVKFDASNMNS
ncbi:hypothetical protein DFH28DRAFT_1126307 [Melampsora americana]|nr:hypothetical protein DFH28DRAFT_1126307 [Melampsora americana]